MEKIDITAKIFGNLDDIFIHFLNELDSKERNHIYKLYNLNNESIDEFHTLIKLVYEKSTHPNDSYHDDGSNRKDWNEVLRLLGSYNIMIERILRISVAMNKHGYLPDELDDEFLFIQKYLPELIL